MTATMRACAGVLSLALTAGPAVAQDMSGEASEDRTAPSAEAQAARAMTAESAAEVEAQLERKRVESARERDAQAVADNLDALIGDPLSAEIGNPDGNFTVVVFNDFSCPHCRDFHPSLIQFSEDNPEVRIIMKALPILGRESVTAAAFATVVNDLAGADAYARAAGKIFDAEGRLSEDVYAEIIEDLDLDREQITDRMKERKILTHLRDNVTLSEALGIRGTPAIVLDDIIVRGAIPLETMQAAYEELREG